MKPLPSDAPAPKLSEALQKEWGRRRLRQSRQFGDPSRLVCPHPEKPIPTILTEFDELAHPLEPRRFTIAEARALSGFPPDYILRGTYADQWARLGNAVPPLMMHAVAAQLRDDLFTRIGRTKPGFKDACAMSTSSEKPPYAVPTMADIAAARGTTGLTVASTFAGCGGSCTGYEMAGYRVLWSNEFLPIAQESYAANHPHTILDRRDIRQVQPGEILDAIGLQPGELDVFNGSPPCQAFSSAGKRERGWGTEREYANGVTQKNEELFFEFIRLLRGLQPRAFVAENVAGLVRGTAIGFFKIIMRELMDAGYAVRCKVLDAQWLGVPQTRTRSIFVGVRKDLGSEPEFPKPLAYRYSLRDACPHIAGMTARGIVDYADFDAKHPPWRSSDEPATCITTVPTVYGAFDKPAAIAKMLRDGSDQARRFTIEECKAICSFPSDYILRGSYADQWARLGNAVPPLMMRSIAETLRDGLFTEIGRTRKAA